MSAAANAAGFLYRTGVIGPQTRLAKPYPSAGRVETGATQQRPTMLAGQKK